jgi:hypothetical protein
MVLNLPNAAAPVWFWQNAKYKEYKKVQFKYKSPIVQKIKSLKNVERFYVFRAPWKLKH